MSSAPADRVLYLAPLPDGPVTVLNGVAALVYEELVSSEPGTIVERLATHLGVSVDDVDRTAVHDLTTELVAMGLLHVTDAGDRGADR